jgi:Trp operon repressor
MSVLDAWRSGTLDVYKTHQENYTSDSPDCPKWQARWASFIDSLTKATNDTEYRTVIQRFMKNQQSRASRLRIANSNNSQTEEIQTESTLAPSSQSLSPPPSAINTVIEPTIHHTAPKQWKVKQIYEHFQANTLDEYKHWCETTHTLSGPEWDIQWYTFTLELQRAPDRPTADSIIRAFIEGLRKKRHDILSQKNNYKANPLERDTRQQWPSVSVLRAWKENKLDLFKEFQENYTSDSPDCPKWQQRWNGFVDSLRDASSDDERKTCISKFMTAQRTRVYRAKKYIRT